MFLLQLLNPFSKNHNYSQPPQEIAKAQNLWYGRSLVIEEAVESAPKSHLLEILTNLKKSDHTGSEKLEFEFIDLLRQGITTKAFSTEDLPFIEESAQLLGLKEETQTKKHQDLATFVDLIGKQIVGSQGHQGTKDVSLAETSHTTVDFRDYLNSGNLEEALKSWYRAVQSPGFGGSITEFPALCEKVEAQFTEHTRRLSPERRDALLAFGSEQKLQQLLEALRDGNYAQILHIPHAEDIALYGFQKGIISLEQVTTLCRLKSYAKERDAADIQQIDLFDALGGSSTPAKDCVYATLFDAIPEEGVAYFKNPDNAQKHSAPHLDEEGVERMFALLKSYPPSERCLFLVPDDQGPMPENKIGATISQTLNYVLKFNVFCRLYVDGKLYRMIPSHSMEKAFFRTCFERPFLLNSIQGPSSPWDLFIGARRLERDMACPSSDSKLPSEADGSASLLSLDFIDHDRYHCFICSIISSANLEFKSHTDLFLDFAEVIKNKFPFAEAKNWVAETIFNHLNDLEIIGYGKKRDSWGQFFWENLINESVLDLAFIDPLLTKWDLDLFFQVMRSLLDYAVNNPEKLKGYGVTLNDCQKVTKNFKDYGNDILINRAATYTYIDTYLNNLQKAKNSTPKSLPLPSLNNATQQASALLNELLNVAENFVIPGTNKKYLAHALFYSTPNLWFAFQSKEMNEIGDIKIRNIPIGERLNKGMTFKTIGASLIEDAKKSLELIEKAFHQAPLKGHLPYDQLPLKVGICAKKLKSALWYLEEALKANLEKSLSDRSLL